MTVFPLPLPPDYEAFLALHRERYLAYARHHRPHPDADRDVAAVLEQLLRGWRGVLSHPNPASLAWRLLTARIHRQAGEQPPAQYDAHVLHRVLGYPVTAVAAAMGQTPATVRYLLGVTGR
ncbi:hypothetical protein [Streptomyces hainanensis]|uniref:Sigma-70 family RNA polymerase sigma factor n=1 Tax=Streptomyces hainanensis TaxID=402648 RepID=A0A4R4T078_9ACTN|nr:hypothetical protein [Streptomyces hainanensis]TDC70141.1 hypothetical protein E1283_25120 [Streptomyces hainanensis]